ncbi:MAG: LamG domain-containing protein [Labilithrix sp.]|nr:LamG domain-containing protein [Labilithrix sp.]
MRSRLASAVVAGLVLAAAAACGAVLPDDDEPLADDAGAAPPDAGLADGPTVDPAPEDGGHDSAYRAAVMADDPVAYFRFEEAAGAGSAVDEAGLHLGTYHGGLVVPGFGGSARARQFAAGSGPVPVASLDGTDTLGFAGRSAMSVEVWLQRSGAAQPETCVLSRYGPSARAPANAGGYRLMLGGATLRFERERADNPFELATPPSMEVGADAHHVVATFDGEHAVLYVDGGEVATADSDVELAESDQPLLIGGCDAPFGGTIDEVAVYAYALGPARVRAHYDAR